MKTLLRDSAFLIALMVAVLYLLGYHRESAYLRHWGLSVHQFSAPPHVVVLNGFSTVTVFPFDQKYIRYPLFLVDAVILAWLLALHSKENQVEQELRAGRRSPPAKPAGKQWKVTGFYLIILGGFGMLVICLCWRADSVGKDDAAANKKSITITFKKPPPTAAVPAPAPAPPVSGIFITEVDGKYAVCSGSGAARKTVIVQADQIERVEMDLPESTPPPPKLQHD